MTTLDTFFVVLYWINMVTISIITLAGIPQLFFLLFSWLPRRHWRPAKTFHKIAIIIPAHNEEDVVGTTVKYVMNELDYPKDRYQVYVVAHNCKDHTAEVAKNAGAIVLTLNDPDPKHARPAYPLAYGYKTVMAQDPDAELFIHLDADNIPCKSFLKEMNNSFDAGAPIIRAYEAASNMMQNIWTKECTLFFTKDCRLQNHFRQNFHMTTMTPGPGLSISRKVLERIGGWDCYSGTDDMEFTWKRLFDGYKCYYNCDAIVYEDQPSSYADTHNRLVRLGHALNRLFFTDGWRMLVMFLRTGNPMYLDIYIQIGFIPISVLSFTILPAYYVIWGIATICQMNGVPVLSVAYFDYMKTIADVMHGFMYGANFWAGSYPGFQTLDGLTGAALQTGLASNAFFSLLNMAWQVILEMMAFCIFQSWLALFLDHRKLGLNWTLKGMWDCILLSPLISVLYGFCNCVGAIRKPKWIIAKRNPKSTQIYYPLPEKEGRKIYYYHLSNYAKSHWNGYWWVKKNERPSRV
jgi:cellulose synthase/poly-beta-1,6-N-acetylglucosamine synthase-like glycosyltransferase